MMDVDLAHKVGAKAVLVPEPGDQYDVGSEMMRSEEKPEFQTDSFGAAVDWILGQT
jgi:hypothetical protein